MCVENFETSAKWGSDISTNDTCPDVSFVKRKYGTKGLGLQSSFMLLALRVRVRCSLQMLDTRLHLGIWLVLEMYLKESVCQTCVKRPMEELPDKCVQHIQELYTSVVWWSRLELLSNIDTHVSLQSIIDAWLLKISGTYIFWYTRSIFNKFYSISFLLPGPCLTKRWY